MFEIVFHADDPAGKAFDVVLIAAIVASVLVVMLESVTAIQGRYARALLVAEWFFTVLFTIEYVIRLSVLENPTRYARSFFGVVDLLAILPTYISLFVPGAQVLLTVRILRALRVFRVLKLANYLDEANTLSRALAASRRKIFVFIFVVLTVVTVTGSLMYLIEGGENGFTSIPKSVYWAVVTVSTIGFGDITPQTPLGQFLSAVLAVVGYGIIAVPTGIVTVELGREQAEQRARDLTARAMAEVQLARCPKCGLGEHDDDARFCKWCGEEIVVEARPLGPAAAAPSTAPA
ncbi:ion transporter [Rubrivirga marina]|uniref:Ion transporter n=1 Tax=Rubrivirga marina TaxID=1196024 RepID=A0A271J5K1_9BACT|nr:ion transporter [Rubrivirga marina]